MADLSDLELVAQAMAPTETAAPKAEEKRADGEQREGGKAAKINGSAGNAENPSETGPRANADYLPDISQIPELADLDPALLASLSLEDRQALAPLLAALQRADAGLEGGEGDEELGDMAEILKQMDQAGEVADELEDKLDRLIRALGEEEEGLKEIVPAEKAPGGKLGDEADK